jgi:hypothetical protein
MIGTADHPGGMETAVEKKIRSEGREGSHGGGQEGEVGQCRRGCENKDDNIDRDSDQNAR